MATKKLPKNPMQPIINDGSRARFKANQIVQELLDFATPKGLSLNQLATMDFSQDDRVQFAQLIGYSVNGFHELSYVPDTAAKAASEAAREQIGDSAGGCRDHGCKFHCGVEEEVQP